MQLDKSSFTIPNKRNEALEELIRENSTCVTYPAKRVFLEPGMEPQGVYYIAEGRTRHYMMAGDGTEKILYTLSAGWFYGETPVSLQEPTGLFSKAEVKTQIYIIPHLRTPGGYQQDVPGRHYGKYSEKDADSAP